MVDGIVDGTDDGIDDGMVDGMLVQTQLGEVKKEIQEVNWSRKNQQTQVGDKLRQLESDWVGLVRDAVFQQYTTNPPINVANKSNVH